MKDTYLHGFSFVGIVPSASLDKRCVFRSGCRTFQRSGYSQGGSKAGSLPSSSISSSSSTSSSSGPIPLPWNEISPLASLGRLKLVLLLELPLLDRILPDDDRPLTPLENEVLRGETGGEGGGCSVLMGDWRTGELTLEPFPARSKEGISRGVEQGDAENWVGEGNGKTGSAIPPSNSSVSALYLTYGVLGSVIFI